MFIKYILHTEEGNYLPRRYILWAWESITGSNWTENQKWNTRERIRESFTLQKQRNILQNYRHGSQE